MDNEGRLYSQVAAQAGVAPEKALAAVYLSNLARCGKRLDEAAQLARMERHCVRDIARDWGFEFVDYQPQPPVRAVWEKAKRGGPWLLKNREGRVIATVESDGHGAYNASVGGAFAADGSSAFVAAKRASREIDRRSVEFFGVEDIEILFRHPDGTVDQVAPSVAENAPALKMALAA
jgi:hypothetical protein